MIKLAWPIAIAATVVCGGGTPIKTAFTQEWGRAAIMRKEMSVVYTNETNITFRLPQNIRIGDWYTCSFFNSDKAAIASLHRRANERVPTEHIKVSNPDSVLAALCAVVE